MSLTSQIRYARVLDSTATDGSGKTGIAFGSFTAKYITQGGTLTSLTTEDITTLGTYQAPTSAAHIRIKELNSADPTKGVYEVHFHNTQMANTGKKLWLFLSASGAACVPLEVDLIPYADLNPTMADNQTQVYVTGFSTNYHLASNRWSVRLAAVAAGVIDDASFASDYHPAIVVDCQAALQSYHLDHLIASADPGGVVANSSFLAKLVSKSATPAFSSYDNTTDSLEASRDNIGTAGAGLTAIDLPDQTMNITGNITGNLSGSVGSVTGAVGSVTGNVGGNVTGSVGSVLGGINTTAGVITTLDGLDTAQDTQHSTTQTKVDTLLSRITSTLFSGITSLAQWLGLMAGKQTPDATALTEIKATGAGSGTYDATTDSLQGMRDTAVNDTDLRGSRTVVRGTVTTGASTTSIPTSAFSPAGAVADQFKGRIVVFDNDTTTAALRGQATDITASSNSSTPTLTVTTLAATPASGDTFSVV